MRIAKSSISHKVVDKWEQRIRSPLPKCYPDRMTNRVDTDLFGNPVGDAQLSLFGEEEGRPPRERYVPKPELVRKGLVSLERRVREAGPETVENWLAPAKVAFFRRQLDELCAKLSQTAPEEVEAYRARVAACIDDLAARLGVAED